MAALNVPKHGWVHDLLSELSLPHTHQLVLVRELASVLSHVVQLTLGILMDVGDVLPRQLLLNGLVVALLLTLEVQMLVELLPIVVFFKLIHDLLKLERFLSLSYPLPLFLNIRHLSLLFGKPPTLNLAPVMLCEVILVFAVLFLDHVAVVLLCDHDLGR